MPSSVLKQPVRPYSKAITWTLSGSSALEIAHSLGQTSGQRDCGIMIPQDSVHPVMEGGRRVFQPLRQDRAQSRPLSPCSPGG